jgi:hypothetical protein
MTHGVKTLGIVDIVERTRTDGQQWGELRAECGLVGVMGDVPSEDDAAAWI